VVEKSPSFSRKNATGRARSREQRRIGCRNLGAVAVELTADDLREIESAASKITVQGARYPEKLEQMAGR